MASIQRQASSSSESQPPEAPVDDRKRKRMVSNRESARRSRMRKQKQLEDLMAEMSRLQNENSAITQRINGTSQQYVEVESANNVLRVQAMELTDRLRTYNSVLQIVEDVSGMPMEIPELPEPWQLPCPMPPIMASSNMFQF
ncbi:hypothetical protein ACFE04_018167 [Oxalis oulophora]